MPPAQKPSVASAASVLQAVDVAQLAAVAIELPPGWVVTVRARDGQVQIHPDLPADHWQFEALVDPQLRMVYAGHGWQARHARDVLARAGLIEGGRSGRGGTRRSPSSACIL